MGGGAEIMILPLNTILSRMIKSPMRVAAFSGFVQDRCVVMCNRLCFRDYLQGKWEKSVVAIWLAGSAVKVAPRQENTL